ncbi:hypothetical protein AVEN_27088-1, partial [Araneus ventricosus]
VQEKPGTFLPVHDSLRRRRIAASGRLPGHLL